MPRVNLLPWREARRKQRQTEFYALLGGAALGAVLLIGLGEMVIGRLESRQIARNDFIRQETAVLDRKIAEIRTLQAEKASLIARMEVIQELQIMRPRAVKLLDGLARTMPDGVMLTRVQQRGETISLDGVAQSNARVSTLMNQLESSDRFREPTLNVIRAGERSGALVSNFSLSVPEALHPSKDDGAAP